MRARFWRAKEHPILTWSFQHQVSSSQARRYLSGSFNSQRYPLLLPCLGLMRMGRGQQGRRASRAAGHARRRARLHESPSQLTRGRFCKASSRTIALMEDAAAPLDAAAPFAGEKRCLYLLPEADVQCEENHAANCGEIVFGAPHRARSRGPNRPRGGPRRVALTGFIATGAGGSYTPSYLFENL